MTEQKKTAEQINPDRKEASPNAPRSSANPEGSGSQTQSVPGTGGKPVESDKDRLVREEQEAVRRKEQERAQIVNPKLPQTAPAPGEAPQGVAGMLMLTNRSSSVVRIQMEVKGGEGGAEWVRDSMVELQPNDVTGVGVEEGRRVIIDQV